ncbi:MAG: globin domain-containing protein [Saprospiraceae bacterium]
MMSAGQIQLVKKNWRLLRDIAPELLADTFYSKLFFDHPELRRLFPKQMDEQYRKLIDMLSAIVARLDKPGNFETEIAELGRRHQGYGVRALHYEMVGEALLWTLEKGLGNDWNEDAAAAWRACYLDIVNGMTRDPRSLGTISTDQNTNIDR